MYTIYLSLAAYDRCFRKLFYQQDDDKEAFSDIIFLPPLNFRVTVQTLYSYRPFLNLNFFPLFLKEKTPEKMLQKRTSTTNK